jgi:predicted Rossmann fold nucleotide-binding protein DprA/Smf involved in DNA uptake
LIVSTALLATSHRLELDTEVTLLLCGRFGPTAAVEGPAPLSVSEYNNVARWLKQHDLRPRDLLAGEWRREGLPLDIDRVQALLARGAALAFAVESWTNQGLWVLGRTDAAYPARLKEHLKAMAPPILYGAGANGEHVPTGGLAIVGSRDADDAALEYTRAVAETCARQGIAVISGGARGVDTTAMEAALAADGVVVGVLADSLAKVSSSKRFRRYLMQGSLTLLSPYHPHSAFNAGNAMARNKYVYGLADWGLVVSAAAGEGGTWAGAIEAIRGGQTPVFVRFDVDAPAGNTRLTDAGAMLFPERPWEHLARQLAEAGISQPVAAAALRTLRESSAGKSRRKAPMAPAPQLSFTVAASTSPVALPSAPQPAMEPQSDSGVADKQECDAVPGAETPAPGVFDAVWPLLRTRLGEPRSKQELAAALEVREPQVQDWLDRAVREGRAIKVPGRPTRYHLAPTALFALGQ